MTYLTNQLMFWGTNKISDHGRSPLNVTTERIETRERMANGHMRVNIVAKKSTWTTSWENLPSRATPNGPVDGGLCGEDMKDFYETTDGSFTLTLRDGGGTTSTYTVMLTDFSYEISKRGANDWWTVNATLVEV